MKTATTIAISDVLGKLRINATNIERIGNGMWSEAFAYQSSGERFVIRISNSDADFCKDRNAYELLHSFGISVPKVFAIGAVQDGMYYAISAQCNGRNLAQQPVSEKQAIGLFDILLKMQQVDVSRFRGWGLMDKHFNGLFSSWNEFLLRFYNQKMDYEIEALAGNSLLTRELYVASLKKIKRLLPYLPKVKNLVHGDYAFDNVIADGNVITGVVDWGEAKLGDWLYDVAYLDFNSNNVPYGELWKHYGVLKKLEIENEADRLLCYKLVIGLGSVAIAAHINDPLVFEEDVQKLEKLIA